MRMTWPILGIPMLAAGALALQAQAADGGYRQPPEPLLGVMRAPLNPSPAIGPTGQRVLLVRQLPYPSIERVAEPYLKLAGVRVGPHNHSRHDFSSSSRISICPEDFSLLDQASGKEAPERLAQTGERFLREVLSRGGSRSALENFTAFRGRGPGLDAVLRHNGMVVAS